MDAQYLDVVPSLDLRGIDDALSTVHIVTPIGQIKTIQFAKNVSSWMIRLERGTAPGESKPRLLGVRVSDAAEREGYALLFDLYKSESRLGDFEKYKEWDRHARAGNVGDDEDVDSKGNRGKSWTFPDEMLPAEVLRRRGKTKSNSARFKAEVPKPPKAKSEPASA